MSVDNRGAGIAAIKAEYLLPLESRPIPDDDSAEGATNPVSGGSHGICGDVGDARGGEEEGSSNRSGQRGKWSKEEKKKRKGANKGRRFGKTRDTVELCWKIANGSICDFGDGCRFTHDVDEYLASKPADIVFPLKATLLTGPPFVEVITASEQSHKLASIDSSTICPIFEETGECRHGLKCRFLGAHVKKDDKGKLEVLRDEEKVGYRIVETSELNSLRPDALKLLRSKKYPQPITRAYMQELESAKGAEVNVEAQNDTAVVMDVEKEADTEAGIAEHPDAGADTPDVPIRFSEKKRLHWEGKTYLAPLTTVGNLPFRRLCVDFGADITCGEMGLATSFLQGSKEEWSLVRRHPSESIFGVQLAGNKPANLTPVAEIIGKEFAGTVDFVDLNCGCPIDLVFRQGSGSALLDAPGKLGKILIGMNKALGPIPLTVKLRTGVKDGRNTSHKLMPRLNSEWGVGAVTLHGRTRQQRYTKLADWDYIKQCANAVRARAADEDLPPIPIFGGGDCYSSEGYWSCVEQSGVDGVMIGRGALIKPWIFTEVKERREWDISSRERLDLIRKYASYAVNHFGSDTAGVNTARRYLCESLSFQHRYIPLGLLEVLPARLNDRPPAFRGRDELETLLASPNSRDWVKISEMFLGPAPEGWIFTPKHKSNAYGSEEGQG